MAKALPEIVNTLQAKGRSAGFTELRDLILSQAGALKAEGISLQALVKMVLEVDRHAMAAEMLFLKTKSGEAPPEWTTYQQYLSGEISLEEYLNTKPGIKAPPPVTPKQAEDDHGEEQRPRKKKRI